MPVPGDQEEHEDGFNQDEEVCVVVKRARLIRHNQTLVKESSLLWRVTESPNVVHLLHSFVGPQDLLRRMVLHPKVEGTLGQLIRMREDWRDASPAGRRPLEGAPMYICQLGRALSYLQSVGVAHRDCASKNIGVTEDGVIKMLDFGAGYATDEGDASTFFYGTPAYQAVECLVGSRSHALADTFSLGTIIGDLLSGHSPFDDGPLGTPSLSLSTLAPGPSTPSTRSSSTSSSSSTTTTTGRSGDGRSSSSRDSTTSLDSFEAAEREVRAQALRRIAAVIGPMNEGDAAALGSRFPELVTAEDAGGKEQELSIGAMYGSRCDDEADREAYVAAISSLLKYRPAERASPWTVVGQFAPMAPLDQLQEKFQDLTNDELEDMRHKMGADAARSLLSLIGLQQ